MSIKVASNTKYPTAVNANDKYNPIDPKGLILDKNDHETLSGMLTKRLKLLKYSGYTTSRLGLQLTVRDSNSLIKGLQGNAPPLVVISSRRAEWIRKGFENGNAILRNKRIQWFNGIMDRSALNEVLIKFNNYPSPPIYFPARLGANAKRSVYILVHLKEYDKYCNEFKTYPAITVIGWNFLGLTQYTLSKAEELSESISAALTGFGASRFAAIEFCKMLNRLSGGFPKLAWHFDDNVVGMASNFKGLEYWENGLSNNNGLFCGFAGLPVTYPRSYIKVWNGWDPRSNDKQKPPTFFQQAVLWNIDFLIKKKLNFGLPFIASSEDVSLSRFIDLKNFGRGLQNVAILKETAALDLDNKGGQEVANATSMFLGTFATLESSDLHNLPAVKVQVQVNRKPKDMLIQEFVGQYVVKGLSRQELIKAACQAVEQITKTAIGKGYQYVDQAALDSTFTGVKVQTVLRESS